MIIPIPDQSDLKNALSLAEEPSFVATGGFKAVFKFTRGDGAAEAIKAVYIPDANPDDDDALLQREQLVARAKREIEALKQCSHPNIVKLGDIIPTELRIGTSSYLVYSEEFLDGESVASWLRAEFPASFTDLLALMTTLTDLIENLNILGYLHRDIKPENIMETSDAKRKFVVLDMGIAYKMMGTELTRGGGPPGTLRYMAPELLRPDYKDNMDFRCDLYSAALTVYVLASKTHPFAPKPEHAYATAYRIAKMSPQPLNTLRPDLPRQFCEIIDRCIRKKPALRYSNILQLKTELKAIQP